MMGDLISREYLLRMCDSEEKAIGGDWDYDALRAAIELAPPADKLRSPEEELPWVHLGGDEWCCPVCGEVITTEGSWEKPIYKYCYECGQKMKLEAKDGY